MPDFTIAIDGPAGAGKSTVAKKIAYHLGFLYIDTGAMYRAVTYEALYQGIDLQNEPALITLVQHMDIQLQTNANNEMRVFINNQDKTEEIRHPNISKHASIVAKVPGVRKELVTKQQMLASKGRVVMEGRDIGTNVLPHATYKFFITASPLERGKRRQKELIEKGYQVDLNTLVKEIEERDHIDSTRTINPLKPAPDAIILDCSNMNAEQVTDFILQRIAGGENHVL